MPPRWLPRRGLLPTASSTYRNSLCQSCKLSASRDFSATYPSNDDVIPLRKQLKDASKSHRIEKASLSSPPPSSTTAQVEDAHSGWELTVGIEIHAQLNTARKLFSSATTEQDALTNERVRPFDIALPGSQPRLQHATLIPAIRAALALNCTIQPVSHFDRKHYFYHDQPAGYQITQYYSPFATGGSVTLTTEDGLEESDGPLLEVGLKQVQMEQDTARTQEKEDGTSLIDFTRSGQPLIEIISLPQIHSPQAAAAYMRKVSSILSAVDAVTTGMELGGLRADVNVSVRRVDGPEGTHSYSGIRGLGQRTEIKNLSSFKAVEDAVKAERDRQINILEQGGIIEGETRGWSVTSPGTTRRLRGKEGEVDYRYMPDPDIQPVRIGRDVISHLRATLPPLPEQLAGMIVDEYGLTPVDAKALILLDDGQRLNYFQDVIDCFSVDTPEQQQLMGKMVGNWVLHELGSLSSSSDTAWTPDLVPYDKLARLIELLNANRITGTSAKRILRTLFGGEASQVDDIVTSEDLWFHPMTEDEYESLVSHVLDANVEVVKDIKEKGKHGKIMYLVGQMMKAGDRNRMEASKAETLLRQRILE